MTIKNGDMPAMPMFSYEAKPGVVRDADAKAVGYSAGLTKREMMAMAAMQGILSSLTSDDDISPRELARYSVSNVDALLAELERTK